MAMLQVVIGHIFYASLKPWRFPAGQLVCPNILLASTSYPSGKQVRRALWLDPKNSNALAGETLYQHEYAKA